MENGTPAFDRSGAQRNVGGAEGSASLDGNHSVSIGHVT